MKQDDIFLDSEGDNWFSRNKDYLLNKSDDIVLDFLENYKMMTSDTKVLEVGCSNGYRLDKIHKIYNSKCYGIEASSCAVEFGKENFSNINIVQGGADKLPYEDESFDLVIINFVLHWIDRKNLMKVISELDRVIKNKGLLLIGDFYPSKPEKRNYHHIKDAEVYTYKQAYYEIFKSSAMYEVVEFMTFNHSTLKKSHNIAPSDRCALVLLKKERDNLYACE